MILLPFSLLISPDKKKTFKIHRNTITSTQYTNFLFDFFYLSKSFVFFFRISHFSFKKLTINIHHQPTKNKQIRTTPKMCFRQQKCIQNCLNLHSYRQIATCIQNATQSNKLKEKKLLHSLIYFNFIDHLIFFSFLTHWTHFGFEIENLLHSLIYS